MLLSSEKIRFIVFIVLILAVLQTNAQISSNFTSDADSWTFLNSTTSLPIDYHPSSGNPGGYVSATYSANVSTGVQSWVAPSKFLGNQLAKSLGMNLRFDLQQSQAGTASNVNGDVRIESTSVTLVYTFPAKPAIAPLWSSYSLKLDESQNWHVGSTGGLIATREQVKTALKNLSAIKIRGTYATNASYTSGIDNIVLEQRTLLIAPTITSFSPTSGEPGTSITIQGSDFNATPNNNQVFFGALAGTVTSASTTQLVVTTPAGISYGPITVVNTITGLTKRSAKPFNPTFSGGGRIIPASFASRIDMATIGNEGTFVGDIDGDGWNDFAVTNNNADDAIEIHRNLGLGGALSTASFEKVTISTQPLSASGVNGAGLWFADLDGDGKIDAVTSNSFDAFRAVFVTLRNTSTPGHISFETPEYWFGASDETAIALVADLDGDGRPELMGGEGAQCGCVRTDFWANQNISTPGDIEFASASGFFNNSVINGFGGASSDDLDNDGKVDLVISNAKGITILRNTSTPGLMSFEHAFTLPVSQTGSVNYDPTITIADFNLDGKNDLAWKDYGGPGTIHIRINTNTNGILEAGDFATEVQLLGDLGGYGQIVVADINGDGKPDIVGTDNTDIGVFENTYSGGIFDATAFVGAYQVAAGGSNPYPFVADFNGDQKPDVMIGTSGGRVSIFENKNIHAPVISVHTVSPLAAPIGGTVTITGNSFSTIKTENTVIIGGVKASVLTASTTQLTVAVPAGASYGFVSVTRNQLTSRYRLPFIVTTTAGVDFDNTHFLPPVSYSLTGANYDVEVADLDNDGKPDIAAEANINYGGFIRQNTLLYRNTHTTGNITATSLTVNDSTDNSAINPRLYDVDGDGLTDIVCPNGLMYNNQSTTGVIAFANNVSLGLGGSTLAYTDLNNDGKVDLQITNSGAAQLILRENRSVPGVFITGAYGTFGANVVISKPSIGGGIASADFDGDGFIDIVTSNPGTDNISIYKNAGTARVTTNQFASRTEFVTGDNPGRIYEGDLDVDGKIDLMLYHGAGINPTMISVFHNESTSGTITFTRTDYTLPAAATVANISDLDGDGKPEIIVTSETTNQFFILKNKSTSGVINASSFAAAFITSVTKPRGLTTGDLNVDGKPEIIITAAPNSLLIFENIIPIGPSISITTQPQPTAACSGETRTLTVEASGTTNLAYQWQKFDGTVFINISNIDGYSGVTMAKLTINTTGNFGAGDYRCKVSGDLAPDRNSETATLTVNAVPVIPTTTGDTNCNAAKIVLKASGGVNGQYRWYTEQTGGVALAGQVNNAYTTPTLSVTTIYYVALNNTLCESARAEVIAEIKPLDKPVITFNPASATGNIIDACEGETQTLIGPAGFKTYQWSNGSSATQINITTSGVFTIVVTDAKNCVSPPSDNINITFNTYPSATIAVGANTLTAPEGEVYQWYRFDEAIENETNQTLAYNSFEFGIYTVDVSNKLCSTHSDPHINLITGYEKTVSEISVYPNPFRNSIIVKGLDKNTVIELINEAGITVIKVTAPESVLTIDTSSLATGHYVLHIQSENRNSYTKIIKN